MQTYTPPHANVDNLRRLVKLGGSSRIYLTAYVNTSREEVVNNQLRAHVTNLLGAIADEVEETPWRDAFRAKRRQVEEFAETIRAGTDALAIVAALDEDEAPEALWLPGTVADEVRVGPGVYILPLQNVLDEWQPLVLAFVQKAEAWLALAAAGKVQEVHEYESDVPGRHEKGGWSQRRYERHILVRVDRHLEGVAEDLVKVVQEHDIDRVFLAGPVEPLTMFKEHLPQHVLERVKGELALDSRTSPDEAVKQVWPLAREVERREEEALVGEITDRAEKNAQGVTGANETLAALNRGEVYHLAMSADINLDGRYCIGSGMLFGPMGAHDPMCQGPVRTVWLRQELPAYALSRGVKLEIVHGDAMRHLNRYGGVGGLLKSPRR